MVVNSFAFWIVFPFLFMFYWMIPSSSKKMKKWYLIAVSYLIYMTFNAFHAWVLVFVTLVTYIGAIKMEGQTSHKKLWLWCFLVACFMPLLGFKYLNFLAESTSALLGWMGIDFRPQGLNWSIPIGISFFTLQAVAYMVEVYGGKTRAERSFTDYMLFVSFFPHIVCGPISLSSELLPQIKQPKPFDQALAIRGLKRVVWGLFLKLVIADRVGIFVDHVYSNFQMFTGTDCLVASLGYSLQIYADFAGYSLMAIGIANTLGYHLVNNFNRPYFSLTVSEFWSRWHISLSRWLKNNVYIPLGGNRCSKLRNYYNILVTFLVSGIWHGANWTFIFWGLLHGVAQVIEKMLGVHKAGSPSWPVRMMRIFITFSIVNLAWIFFRMSSLEKAFSFIGQMASDSFSPFTLADETNLLYTLLALPILLAVDCWEEFFRGRSRFKGSRYLSWAFYIGLVLMIMSVGVVDAGQFIYAQF